MDVGARAAAVARAVLAGRSALGGIAPRPGDIDDWTTDDWRTRLAADPASDVFDDSEIEGLPEPVQRYFRAAVAPGTLLAPCARLRMRGRIKVRRWVPFRAREILNPHVGFRWSARAAALIAGYDRYLDGAGAMNWKLGGVFDVAHGDGPDVSRSAAGRCGGEAIWIPTTLLPRFGVRWTADADDRITAHHQLDATPIDLRLTIDATGSVRSIAFDRWGDPDQTGTWARHAFGGEITAHRSLAGLTIPSRGRLGWHVGTDRWADGEFFRFEITDLDFPSPPDRAITA